MLERKAGYLPYGAQAIAWCRQQHEDLHPADEACHERGFTCTQCMHVAEAIERAVTDMKERCARQAEFEHAHGGDAMAVARAIQNGCQNVP